MSTPDLTYTTSLTIPSPPPPAARRHSDSAAEAGMAHVLSTKKNTVPSAPDLSWTPEEDNLRLEN